MREVNHMKYLKIEENRGYYQLVPETWIEIDKINKDDLMALLNLAVESDFEMDAFDITILANKAHQIIYKNLSEKFTELLNNKNRFKDESELIYAGAIDKYTNENEE